MTTKLRICIYKLCLQCSVNERDFFVQLLLAFFYLVRWCTMFGSILRKRRSSFTDSFHVFHGLHLPWQPTTSTWVQWFIYSSLLSTCSYHLRQFILSLDSRGGTFNPSTYYTSLHFSQFWPYTSNVRLHFHFLADIKHLLSAQHWLAWSKARLTQLLNNIPYLANEIVGMKGEEEVHETFPMPLLFLQ